MALFAAAPAPVDAAAPVTAAPVAPIETIATVQTTPVVATAPIAAPIAPAAPIDPLQLKINQVQASYKTRKQQMEAFNDLAEASMDIQMLNEVAILQA